MEQEIIKAIIKHAEGHIEKHIMNVKVLLAKQVGVAEHPDLLQTIENEIAIVAKYDEQVEMLRKYFIQSDKE
tara:strand:- start:415 stop:630 length:216 start_codon:yes stop_codon:yes gene_type:complete